MPTRKQSAGASKKAGARKSSPDLMSRPRVPNIPPYGVGIREAIARGDAGEMRRVAAQARKHVADVQKALQQLERKLGQS